MAELQNLIARRTTLKQQFTRYKNQVDFNSRSAAYFKLFLSKMEPIHDQIFIIDTEISEIDVDQSNEEYLTSSINTVAQLYELIENLSDNTDSNKSNSENKSNVSLPRITLPTFDGAFEHWTAFRDTFLSLIHNNASITAIEKFHYLKASLINDAKRVIDALELSERNYNVAWQTLVDRFDNKMKIIKNHVKALLNINNINRNNLRDALDTVIKNVRALAACGQPVDSWDTLLIGVLSSKLDYKINEEWESHTAEVETPSFDIFVKFLDRKCKIMEAMVESVQKSNTRAPIKPNIQKKSFLTNKTFNTNSSDIKCMCSGKHQIHFCPKFTALTTQERYDYVKANKLCVNCLKNYHKVSDCKFSNCRKCNLRHNTLLHFERSDPQATNTDDTVTKRANEGTAEQTVSMHTTVHSLVLLSTAIIKVKDNNGYFHEFRALLDSGSQANLVTERAVRRLNLKSNDAAVEIVGVNSFTKSITKSINLCIASRIDNYKLSSNFLVIDQISNKHPNAFIERKLFNIPSDLSLADPQFNVPDEIDFLIGAEKFHELLVYGKICKRNGPILQNSKLGWIISGTVAVNNSSRATICNYSAIRNDIEKFWQIEELPDVQTHSHDEKYWENHFKNNYKRDVNGRFIVKLPLKQSTDLLGESKTMAINRLKALERKFVREPTLENEYKTFMSEYLELGHMREIISDDDNKKTYYLPHHAVRKDDSLTTKVRVVFDASAKTTTGVSLNDILHVGPTIQQTLFNLVIRFRTYKYALTADITKMYRQVLIESEQRSLQRIVWRQNSNENIKCYELNTVTYGTGPASFLSTRCLQEIAFIEEIASPAVSKIISRDFYVDDLITGANSIEDAIELQREVSAILAKGAFELRKWAANDESVLVHVKNKEQPNTVINFDHGHAVKTLGIQWNCASDTFSYSSIDFNVGSGKITKRKMLSDIAKIFDPLGLISPVLIRGKIIMQNLWQNKLSWDDIPPTEIINDWNSFRRDLNNIKNVQINRNIFEACEPSSIQLHGFCDASNDAYGASIYIRATTATGKIIVNLLCSKTRVAPLKTLSIPRLELCGALLLSKLFREVAENINLKFENVCLWTDSTIVIAWIKSESRAFQTFVANRIAQIQTLTKPSHWKHVRSNENSADILSRGTDVDSLTKNVLWWHGPRWLQLPSKEWPNSKVSNTITLPEQKKVVNITKINQVDSIFDRFSNYTRLIRTISYCYRFINNCRNERKASGPLSVNELCKTNLKLIVLIQQECYGAEKFNLENNKAIPRSSKLLKLAPFLDNNIIKVGGRLQHADMPLSRRFPIILPGEHRFTELLIQYTHRRHYHAGAQTTLAILRDEFWVINGRDKIRKIIRKCIDCFRVNPRPFLHKMGDLPKVRLTSARAFKNCGVDYGGPILIKRGTGRVKGTIKAYFAVFVCLATRAVHIELVTELSANAFILALKRLISRRGKVVEIYSDNATNFKGASNELRELYEFFQRQTNVSELINLTANEAIHWHFIPPNSPHFGGIWEAGVKSIKYHLKRVVKNAMLTYEELNTVLIQIEAILNSRPLSPLSTDPSDFSPLTPAHLVIGDSLTANPEPDVLDLRENRLSRFQHLERIRQHFWKRWSQEYIANLQERSKWHTNGIEVMKDQLVLIKDENLPPLQWAIGRVVDLHPGHDKVTRVASVKTTKGVFRRAIRKLCPLPLADEQFGG